MQECSTSVHMAVCQNLVPLVNIKIAGKWMFIPLKMVLIGIDPSPYGLSMPMVPQWFVNICWYIIVSECPRMYQNMFQYIRMQQNIGTMCYMRETMWNMPRKGKKSLDSKPISRKSPLSPELPCFHSLDEIAPWQQRPRHFTATPEFPKNQQDDLHQGNNKCENRNQHLITVPLCSAVQSQLST